MTNKHLFAQYPGGRQPNSCVRCGLPRDHPEHIALLDQAIKKADKANERLARSDLLMQVAELYAKRSTCLRGQVGAVIVQEGRIISCGYNGAPSNAPDCLQVGCEAVVGSGEEALHWDEEKLLTKHGCQRAIHAEANAIVWAARIGVPTIGCEMYCTHAPCATCARLIVAAGICKVHYKNDYRAARLDILDQGLCQAVKV